MILLRCVCGVIFFGTPCVMIYAAGMHESATLFFGSWIGGSVVGGGIAAWINE